MRASEVQQAGVLHVAVAPAQIALDEVEQGGRIGLETAVLDRQYANLPAGAAHQHCLDLVMTEYMAAERRAARHGRQAAMRDERRESDDRIVAPVRTGIALPPRAARRVRTHAVPHAELEDSRERHRRRQAYDQSLQDAEARIALHQGDHAPDR